MRGQYIIYFADKDFDGREGVSQKFNTEILNRPGVKAINISCDGNGVLLLYEGPSPEELYS